jgi:zinc D-Ala-D-Ala dipeptidase
LSDPRVAAVPVLDSGEPLTELDESFGSSRALVRVSVARRLALARAGLLAQVLRCAGLVNYPTEWWHWTYGDRYWALMTGAAAAVYGPAGPDQVRPAQVGPAQAAR